MIIIQVRKPQCLVLGLSLSESLSLLGGGSSADVGQAYCVRQSSRKIPSLNDRK
jgi:hypothetical protein